MSKFSVIVADPPWQFQDKLEMSDVPRGAAANYPLLDLEEIKRLPVKDVADPNGCVLALWVPSSMLLDGLEVMAAWGFEQKQTYVWVKTKKKPLESLRKLTTQTMKIGKNAFTFRDYLDVVSACCTLHNIHDILSFYMGHLFRQTHEICLLGINNTKVYKGLQNKSQRSVSFGENLKHSAKPEHLQDSLELMFPNAKKLEMFARRERDEWVTVGNEVCAGEDIRASIQRLADSPNENIAA